MNVDTSSIAVEIPVVVAVDGPAGSGKSSVSRAAAAKLGFGYLDTGAAYRALAWWALESGVDVADASQIVSLLDGFDYRGGVLPTDRAVVVGDVDVTEAIRTERVSGAVSAVARVPEVRLHLNRLFGAIIAVSAPGIVVEGRDITTVVAPDAAVRVLLTADESVRMARRSAEAEGSSVTAEDAATLAAHVAARDAADSKVNNFLTAADGVHTLDSTHLNFEQTVDALVSLVTDARRP